MPEAPTARSVRPGPGKASRLRACNSDDGIIAALAIDQRGSLRSALGSAAVKLRV